ncbi:helix-turn-helix transcriptional regulator [Deinococcus sp. VB142]|uniref:Helix-turn-helix transcriptional regulator n=1 Tax=Deinococcus sp. VB142 TaxID=3112952 RepID=A0AAU6Q352_9DEIO
MLRELREAQSLSREALARAAGISAKTIEAHEYGRTADVGVSIAFRIAVALGVSLDDLFSAEVKAMTLKEGSYLQVLGASALPETVSPLLEKASTL